MTEPTHPPENPDRDPDTEERLAKIYQLSNQEKAVKEERERLRDELLADGFDGSRYFIDENGNKLYGFRVAPEPIEIDVNLLESYVPAEVLNEVTTRVVDKEKFKAAVATQRIKAEVFVKVAKKKPQKAHIRFGDPSTPPKGA